MPDALYRAQTPAGTEILIQPLSSVRSCSLGFWVKRGSCHEAVGEEGMAHFIEHTVFKGTEHFPNPEALSAATDALGGHVDAFTGKETACFYGKVLRDQLPDLVALLGDLVTSPRFEAEELSRERGVILEEIAQSEDQPDDWVSELFYMNFWKDGALAHPILGRPEQVSTYGPEAARAFFGKTYRAPNLLIAAAGDLVQGGLMDLLSPVLERLPKGSAPTDLRSEQAAPSGRRPDAQALSAHQVGGKGGDLREGSEQAVPPSYINRPAPFLLNVPRKDLQQVSLVMGFPASSHRHRDRVAVNLLSHVLGGGMSSRLFMELREKRGLCYQVGSFLSHYEDTGALQISAGCSADKAREFVQRTAAECARLAREGVGPEELDRAKLQARTSLVFSQESTSARMFGLAHQAIHQGQVLDLDGQLAEIEAVSLDQVNRVAAEVLDLAAFGVAALGTRKGGEIRKEDLAG